LAHAGRGPMSLEGPPPVGYRRAGTLPADDRVGAALVGSTVLLGRHASRQRTRRSAGRTARLAEWREALRMSAWRSWARRMAMDGWVYTGHLRVTFELRRAGRAFRTSWWCGAAAVLACPGASVLQCFSAPVLQCRGAGVLQCGGLRQAPMGPTSRRSGQGNGVTPAVGVLDKGSPPFHECRNVATSTSGPKRRGPTIYGRRLPHWGPCRRGAQS
jgi:hypothetical protein